MEYDAVYVPKASKRVIQMSLQNNDEIKKKMTQASSLEIGIYASYISQALEVGRSRVRFPMVSLEFFIDIILSAALCSWGRLSL